MKRFSLRIFVASITLSMLWLLSTTAQASPPHQENPTPTPTPLPGISVPGQEMSSMGGEADSLSDLPDCRECHWDIYLIWEESTHGKGLSCSECHLAVSEENNHARSGHGAQDGGSTECMTCHTTGYNVETDTWSEGNIHCTACHSPIPPTHPEEPAPTNRSSDLCGQCHIQANFEWQVSTHGLSNVSCVDCHNQHRASLKTPTNDIENQCASCHQTLEAGFTRSMHAEEGISCADCHLAPLGNVSLAGGNARLNHTFEVDINACMQCHLETLHAPKDNHEEGIDLTEASEIDAMTSAVDVEVNAEPPESNPENFMAFATVFGVGAGMGAISWVANLFRKAIKRKKK